MTFRKRVSGAGLGGLVVLGTIASAREVPGVFNVENGLIVNDRTKRAKKPSSN